MAFAPLKFTAIVQSDPQRASTLLSNRFARLGTTAAVAADMRAGVNTLKRWIAALATAGHPLRKGVRRRRGWPLGKPRGHDIALNFRGNKKRLRRP